jgi:hypothetical protein
VTGLLLGLLLGALPEGSARYRVELAGEVIGVVGLSVRCEGPSGQGSQRCRARWESTTRLPAEAGGGTRSEIFDREVDPSGAEQARDSGRAGSAVPSAVPDMKEEVPGTKAAPSRRQGLPPAFLLELLLRDATRRERCLEVTEERSGRIQKGCGRAVGGQVWVTLDGEPERVDYDPDGFPTQVVLPAQRTRFVRDAAAAVPDTPPRLFGVEVEGPTRSGEGRIFCGVARDRPGASVDFAAGARLPPPQAPGHNCREKTAAWIEQARGAGYAARTAVGIAWTGSGWSWHAWAEVQLGREWVAVDPSFGQLPGINPRFTLATWAPGDEAAQSAAGRRILGCWGKARVEQ